MLWRFGWGWSWISELVLAGKHHMFRVMGAPFLQVLCVWGMMQYERSPWQPQTCLLYFPLHCLLLPSMCCYADFACSHSFISVEEVWNPVKVKRRRGDHKQSMREDGRSVHRQETCSFQRFGSSLPLYKQKNTSILFSSTHTAWGLFFLFLLDVICAPQNNCINKWCIFLSFWLHFRATVALKHCGKCTCSRFLYLGLQAWEVINRQQGKIH